MARCHLPHRRETSALTTRGGGAPPHATRGRTFSPCPRLPYTIHSLHTVSGSFTCLHIASGAAEGEGLSFEARHECVHATEDLEESEEIRVTTKPHMPWLYLDVSAQVVERPPSPAIRIREPAYARLPNSRAACSFAAIFLLSRQPSHHSCRHSLYNRVNALTLITSWLLMRVSIQ